jgi:uncharacterized protein with GYD domain
MPTYISLIHYTERGMATIKDSPKRLDAGRKLLKSLGGELRDFYLTMGPYDVVIVIEAPDDEVVARFALTLGAQGNVRTTHLRAFTEPEYRRIIDALPGGGGRSARSRGNGR